MWKLWSNLTLKTLIGIELIIKSLIWCHLLTILWRQVLVFKKHKCIACFLKITTEKYLWFRGVFSLLLWKEERKTEFFYSRVAFKLCCTLKYFICDLHKSDFFFLCIKAKKETFLLENFVVKKMKFVSIINTAHFHNLK